jgi:hypothetical protein
MTNTKSRRKNFLEERVTQFWLISGLTREEDLSICMFRKELERMANILESN